MSKTLSPEQRARDFLATAHLYQLGRLPTESSHPQTRNLSRLAHEDVPQAARLLQTVDLQALLKFQSYLPQLIPLWQAMHETLEAGRRVFICGCGATGRLALSIEALWREIFPSQADRVVAFMAGGDVALVHSLEGFEDFPDYGAEQLIHVGFSEGDLFIGSSEGGETPFVIGATEEAARRSTRKAFFLYCNPTEILMSHIERSRRIFTNPGVQNISLFVGPMALAGSTRMQASTVLQAAIGIGLLETVRGAELANRIGAWIDHYREFNTASLAPFIVEEAQVYREGGAVLYVVENLAITVFTDTTERSPTFSLPPFNNQLYSRPDHSSVYIMIPSAQTGEDAWRKLLKREPRFLNWPHRNSKTTKPYLEGFDFSASAEAYRKKVLPDREHRAFTISLAEREMIWKFGASELKIPRFGRGLLYDHLLLKMLLNIHSTLVMGRLGRYESNFMTHVAPTNGKLVDRASRYVKWLLANANVPVPSDEVVVGELFRQLDDLSEGEAVVVKTAQALGGALG